MTGQDGESSSERGKNHTTPRGQGGGKGMGERPVSAQRSLYGKGGDCASKKRTFSCYKVTTVWRKLQFLKDFRGRKKRKERVAG